MILSGPEVDPIPAGQSRVVLFDLPGISLFNSHYLLPIGRFPVELSLELVSDAKLVCATKTIDAAGARLPTGPDADILSTTFTLEDVQIKADTLLLDSAVTANIDEALTQGKPLTLHLRPWTVQRYTVAVAGASINFSQIFSRAYSRLLSMFINFYPKKVPDQQRLVDGVQPLRRLARRRWRRGLAPRHEADLQLRSRHLPLPGAARLAALPAGAHRVLRGGLLPAPEVRRRADDRRGHRVRPHVPQHELPCGHRLREGGQHAGGRGELHGPEHEAGGRAAADPLRERGASATTAARTGTGAPTPCS
jgi:hypothetical protein